MLYKKLKRTWSNGYANYVPNFKKVFPELKKLTSEELCDRFIELQMDFYHEEKAPTPLLIRLTMPFAVILFVVMLVGVPFNYLATGRWGYSLGKDNKILNWFRSVGLQ